MAVGGGGGGTNGHQPGGGGGYVSCGTFKVAKGETIQVVVGAGGHGAFVSRGTNIMWPAHRWPHIYFLGNTSLRRAAKGAHNLLEIKQWETLILAARVVPGPVLIASAIVKMDTPERAARAGAMEEAIATTSRAAPDRAKSRIPNALIWQSTTSWQLETVELVSNLTGGLGSEWRRRRSTGRRHRAVHTCWQRYASILRFNFISNTRLPNSICNFIEYVAPSHSHCIGQAPAPYFGLRRTGLRCWRRRRRLFRERRKPYGFAMAGGNGADGFVYVEWDWPLLSPHSRSQWQLTPNCETIIQFGLWAHILIIWFALIHSSFEVTCIRHCSLYTNFMCSVFLYQKFYVSCMYFRVLMIIMNT